jgi:hypothetical protein
MWKSWPSFVENLFKGDSNSRVAKTDRNVNKSNRREDESRYTGNRRDVRMLETITAERDVNSSREINSSRHGSKAEIFAPARVTETSTAAGPTHQGTPTTSGPQNC